MKKMTQACTLLAGLIMGLNSLAADFVKVPVQEKGVQGDLFYKPGNPKQKAIVLLGGGEGGRIWSSDTTATQVQNLLDQGYVLLSLAYIGEPGLPALPKQLPIEYFDNAINWLKNQPQVRSDQGVAILGFSTGAQAAMLTAAYNHDVQAVVSVSGPSHISQSYSDEHLSAWTRKGVDIPYLNLEFDDLYAQALQTYRWHEVNAAALKNEVNARKSITRIEKADSAFLFISGEQDETWDSKMMGDLLVQRLDKIDYDHPYRHQSYPGGHGVIIQNPDSWSAITSFLKTSYPANNCPPTWNKDLDYTSGSEVSYNGQIVKAKWSNHNKTPMTEGKWSAWQKMGSCQ